MKPITDIDFNPISDAHFKVLFGPSTAPNSEYKEWLKSFIGAVFKELKISKEEVKNIKTGPQEISIGQKFQKEIRMDNCTKVYVNKDSSYMVNIEMQSNDKESFLGRLFLYGSSLYNSTVKKGEIKYEKI